MSKSRTARMVEKMRFTLFSRKSIDQVMDDFRSKLLKSESDSVRRLLRIYEPIERSLFERWLGISRLIAASPGIDTETRMAWLKEQERYKDFLIQVQTQIEAYAALAYAETEAHIKNQAAKGAKDAEKIMNVEVRGLRARPGLVPESFRTLNTAAIEEIAGSFAPGSPLRSLFNEFGPNATRKAEEIIAAGIAEGINPRQIGKTLSLNIKELSRDRAVTISRNESMRAYTTATKRTYEVNSDVIQRSRIVSALDTRTCMLCWARHGTILEHGEPLHRHVGCRCMIAPVTLYSPKWATGEQEFMMLSDADQKKILGDARYKMFKDGRIGFDDLYVLRRDKTWGPTLGQKNITNLPKREPGSVKPAPIGKDTRSVLKIRQKRGIATK